LEAKVKEMEETLQFNQQTIEQIKQVLHYLANNKEHIEWKRLYKLIGAVEQLTNTQSDGVVRSVVNRTTGPMLTTAPEYCRFSESAPSKTDIQVFLIFCQLSHSWSIRLNK